MRCGALCAVFVLFTACMSAQAGSVAIERMFYSGEPAPYVLGDLAFRDGGPIIGTSNGPAMTGARVRLQGNGVISGNARAIFRGSPELYSLVARAGSSAPGLSPDVIVSAISNPFVDLGADGSSRFAFKAQLAGSGVDQSNDTQAYVVDLAGNAIPLVREGEQSPGFPTGVTISPPTAVAFRSDGSVVFRASLIGSPISEAIFSGTPGSIVPLSPGQTPGGLNVADMGNPEIDSLNQIVVTGHAHRAVYNDLLGQWNFSSRQSIITSNPTVEVVRTARNGVTCDSPGLSDSGV